MCLFIWMQCRWCTQFLIVCLCVCDPDPASFPVQLNDNPADLPPELPPKGIRRRQPPTKVEKKIFFLVLYLWHRVPVHKVSWRTQKWCWNKSEQKKVDEMQCRCKWNVKLMVTACRSWYSAVENGFSIIHMFSPSQCVLTHSSWGFPFCSQDPAECASPVMKKPPVSFSSLHINSTDYMRCAVVFDSPRVWK